jgi:hypothetical protein
VLGLECSLKSPTWLDAPNEAFIRQESEKDLTGQM